MFFIWILRPVEIISLILNRINRKVGRKREISEKKKKKKKKKTLDHRKQNLASLTCDRVRLETTAVWDGERFRALKIGGLNHSATEATRRRKRPERQFNVWLQQLSKSKIFKQWRNCQLRLMFKLYFVMVRCDCVHQSFPLSRDRAR